MTPEERATQAVNNFTGDEYWIDKESSIASVAAAIRAAIEAERTRMERHLIDARLRYTEGEYAVGWNNAIESVLNFLDLPTPV